MNRQSKIQTASNQTTGSRTLLTLVAAGALLLTSSGITSALAAEPTLNPSDLETQGLETQYLEPGDGPAYDLGSLLHFSRKITRSITAAAWSNKPQTDGPETDWFSIRTPQEYETDTTLIPIREDGDFGGMMVNFEVKY